MRGSPSTWWVILLKACMLSRVRAFASDAAARVRTFLVTAAWYSASAASISRLA